MLLIKGLCKFTTTAKFSPGAVSLLLSPAAVPGACSCWTPGICHCPGPALLSIHGNWSNQSHCCCPEQDPPAGHLSCPLTPSRARPTPALGKGDSPGRMGLSPPGSLRAGVLLPGGVVLGYPSRTLGVCCPSGGWDAPGEEPQSHFSSVPGVVSHPIPPLAWRGLTGAALGPILLGFLWNPEQRPDPSSAQTLPGCTNTPSSTLRGRGEAAE